MTSNTPLNIKNIELKPQWARKEKINTNLKKLNELFKKQDDREKQKRRDFLESDEFLRKYDLPYNLYDKFINHSWFKIDDYLIENIEQKRAIENKLINRADSLYDNFIDNYTYYVENLDENSLDFDNFFYKDIVFIEESMDRKFCDDIKEILKKEFYSDYFNPFLE